MSRPAGSSAPRRVAAALSLALLASAVQTATATAGPGYQLDSAAPSIATSAEVPIGVAVDQSSQDIYVAELSENLFEVHPGRVEQFDSAGTPTSASPFGTGGADLFSAVAVNPVTHGIYTYQGEGSTPFGYKGKSTISTFSSSGVLGASFFPDISAAGTLAADSSGRLFFPSSGGGSVQIFDSSGTLEGSVTCNGCEGGAFGSPVGAAFDSAGKLYVVDRSKGGRLIRFTPSGGGYAYDKVISSGGGITAVAVDTSDDDVFVGKLSEGEYHVIAYDSSGTPFDDFGGKLVTSSLVEGATGQLAVNATTHRVYLSNPGGKKVWVFERISSIPAPTASTMTATGLGQVTATLRASVNPMGHVLTSCSFEYTDHADFLANGYANADTAPCPSLVGSQQAVTLSAAVSGLNPQTTYDYRIQIANYGGSADGGHQSLQTLPPLPPEATSGAATLLTKNSATLGGSVNPKGGTISDCHFEYVTEAAFQSSGFSGAASQACTTTPTGVVFNAVSAPLTGLIPGTDYRFRTVATNNTGTTQAAASSFTTIVEICSENAALCPPPPEAPAQTPTTTPTTTPPPTTPVKKRLKCRRGFKKKRVRGKLRCVRVKRRRAARR